MEIKDSGKTHSYIHRHVGDTIGNNATLVQRVNGQKWEIRCQCGQIFIGQPSNTSGLCWKCSHEKVAQGHIKHNESPDTNKKASRLYRIWLGMRARCNTPSASGYKYYGERGIVVCSEWDDYLKFKTWALSHGYKNNLTIERKDMDGNYTPDNCIWITHKEQMQNTHKTIKITYNNETKNVAEWSKITGIDSEVIRRRLRKHMSIQDIFTLPVKKRKDN